MRQTLRLLILSIGMCSVLLVFNFIAILNIEKQNLAVSKDTTLYSMRDVNVIKYRSIVRATSNINCLNIHEIVLKKKLGNGWFKGTYEGDFHGMPVAVKFPLSQGSAYTSCMRHTKNLANFVNGGYSNDYLCFHYIVMKFMREIFILDQLDHPQLARLLGYCIRDPDNRSDTVDLTKRGMIMVTELAIETNHIFFSWKQQLKQAAAIADLLNYLEHSPLGSMTFGDFKPGHFPMSNGTFKLIDVDAMLTNEALCEKLFCDDGMPCPNGVCKGNNSILNMELAEEMFISLLSSPLIP